MFSLILVSIGDTKKMCVMILMWQSCVSFSLSTWGVSPSSNNPKSHVTEQRFENITYYAMYMTGFSLLGTIRRRSWNGIWRRCIVFFQRRCIVIYKTRSCKPKTLEFTKARKPHFYETLQSIPSVHATIVLIEL